MEKSWTHFLLSPPSEAPSAPWRPGDWVLGDWVLGDHLGSPAEMGSEVAHGSSCPGRIYSPPTPRPHLLHPQIDASGYFKKKIKFGKSHLSFKPTASCKAPLPPPLPLLWMCGPHPQRQPFLGAGQKCILGPHPEHLSPVCIGTRSPGDLGTVIPDKRCLPPKVENTVPGAWSWCVPCRIDCPSSVVLHAVLIDVY